MESLALPEEREKESMTLAESFLPRNKHMLAKCASKVRSWSQASRLRVIELSGRDGN